MRQIAIAFVIFLICISVAGASANEEKAGISKIGEKLGYTIVPTNDTINDEKSVYTVSTKSLFTIVQGQTAYHEKDVNSYIEILDIDLNWGNPSNSLKLYVYNPSGNCMGYFYDLSDGSIDGRIRISVCNFETGVQQGTWKYRVYGYSVTGTEDYYI